MRFHLFHHAHRARALSALAALSAAGIILTACGGTTSSDRVVAGEGKVQAAAVAEAPVETTDTTAGVTETPVAATDFDIEAKSGPPTTRPVTPGPKTFDMTARELRVKVGDKVYAMWSYGTTVPGPVMRVVEGDSVTINMTNDSTSALPHSIDFHSARISPTRAFRSIMPGESISYTFIAEYPGVYMYHCGTPPVLLHIGMGMYGMMIVQPKAGYGEEMQEVALVQSELYTNFDTMESGTPEAFAFNGIPGQYAKNQVQLTGKRPKLRVFFLNAGPSELSSFHVVGTVFDKVLTDGNPLNPSGARQALALPASGGGVFEMEFVENGSYPFVSHQFNQAGKGAVGLFRVGNDPIVDGEHR